MKTNYTIRKHLFLFAQITVTMIILVAGVMFSNIYEKEGVPLILYIMLGIYALCLVMTVHVVSDEYRRFKRKLRR